MTMIAHKTASENGPFQPFTFTGKEPRKGNRTPMKKIKYSEERDAETGYSYFGARYYDSDLSGLFLSVDPMADKYPSITPLNTTHKSALRFRDTQSLPECPQDILLQELVPYCAWNPLRLVDPNGAEVAPIYDKWGNFLGTDDQGLKGKAIVMDEKNFTQGMSHDDALVYDLGEEGFQDEIAYGKYARHYAGLQDRPDYSYNIRSWKH